MNLRPLKWGLGGPTLRPGSMSTGNWNGVWEVPHWDQGACQLAKVQKRHAMPVYSINNNPFMDNYLMHLVYQLPCVASVHWPTDANSALECEQRWSSWSSDLDTRRQCVHLLPTFHLRTVTGTYKDGPVLECSAHSTSCAFISQSALVACCMLRLSVCHLPLYILVILVMYPIMNKWANKKAARPN
jgi:hypothetical protein